MARTSSIEQFVEGYLRKFRNKGNFAAERPFLDKSIKLIDFFLGYPCCVDPDGEVTFARRDNILTRFIKANSVPGYLDRRKWRKSLERTKTLLRNMLYDPCCLIPFTFSADATSDCFGEGVSIPVIFTENTTGDIHVENVRFKQDMPVHYFRIPAGTYTVQIQSGKLTGTLILKQGTVAGAFGSNFTSGVSSFASVVIGEASGNINKLVADCS